MSIRFRICLAVWVVTVACSLVCGSANAEVYDVTDDWAVEILPAVKGSEINQVILTAPAATSAGDAESDAASGAMPVVSATCGQDYQRIYDSIPFNRAEYNVNPSYRHDSTMELLTGNARHQTILQHSTAPIARRRPRYGYVPYRYNNPRYGLNYYFYFPYWNYRGIY